MLQRAGRPSGPPVTQTVPLRVAPRRAGRLAETMRFRCAALQRGKVAVLLMTGSLLLAASCSSGHTTSSTAADPTSTTTQPPSTTTTTIDQAAQTQIDVSAAYNASGRAF